MFKLIDLERVYTTVNTNAKYDFLCGVTPRPLDDSTPRIKTLGCNKLVYVSINCFISKVIRISEEYAI